MQLLEYFEAKRLLDRYGIHSVESRYVSSPEDAVRFASGKPVAMKVISGKALHKSKAGLVRLNVGSEQDVRRSYAELSRRAAGLKPYRIIAQKMAKPGVETIVGSKTDEQFGKFVLMGLGGIYVEAFRDFSLRLCPITRMDAEDMLGELRSRSIITHSGRSEKRVVDMLLKLSDLVSRNEGIREIDLNPVIIRDDGYDVVDIRILK